MVKSGFPDSRITVRGSGSGAVDSAAMVSSGLKFSMLKGVQIYPIRWDSWGKTLFSLELREKSDFFFSNQ